MLTQDQIRTLAAAGETLEIELNGEGREALGDQDLVDAVVCLANGTGGTLLVGIEDDGRITGARPRHGARTDVHRVQALLSNSTVPAVAANAYLVPVGGHEVLVIEVPRATLPTATSRGKYVRRAMGGDGRPMCTPFFVAQSIGAGLASDPSAIVVPGATWADLDPVELARLRRTIEENPGRSDQSLLALSDLDIAKALGLVEANGAVQGVRRSALLMVGREAALRAHLPTHEVAWQVLHGTQVVANEFFRWPLLRAFEEIVGRFRGRNTATELYDRG